MARGCEIPLEDVVRYALDTDGDASRNPSGLQRFP